MIEATWNAEPLSVSQNSPAPGSRIAVMQATAAATMPRNALSSLSRQMPPTRPVKKR